MDGTRYYSQTNEMMQVRIVQATNRDYVVRVVPAPLTEGSFALTRILHLQLAQNADAVRLDLGGKHPVDADQRRAANGIKDSLIFRHTPTIQQ